MIPIGINGFGRIGKLIFIQLLTNENFIVKAINVPNLDMKYMETYLKYDSVHKYNTNWSFEIIDDNHFKINNNIIEVFKNRNAKELDWKSLNIEYVIDATGAYLTTEKCKQHNSNYVIMCAPPKDNSPLFVYKVNDEKYNGENIVSNASCTTNCITPVLKLLDDKFKINNANFTTIHSTTASQNTVDTVNSNNRTHRSILNNIIPHSTGASSSIFELIPSLTNKIYGTSLRVPVSNVSLVDLNVEFDKETTLEEIMNEFEKDDLIQVNNLNLVSSDFITNNCPSIIDKKASMSLGNNRFKLMIWYDNEWSYCAQLIRLVQQMYNFNFKKSNELKENNLNKYFIDNFNFNNKNVVLRVDWNVPVDYKNEITDDFRIISSLQTINRILNDNPNKLIILSHFGRPKDIDLKYSFKNLLNKIRTYFKEDLCFLENGLSEITLDKINNTNFKLYLLENIRFHDEETNYKKYDNDNECIKVINKLGDFFVNDAFGCMHRDHLSISGIQLQNKAYGYLVQKELEALDILMNNKNNKKILAIIGGAKVADKLPLLETLSKKMNSIYIAGGNINGIIKENKWDFIEKISKNKASIHYMKDGLCAKSLNDSIHIHYKINELENKKDYYFYDIGLNSLKNLESLIKENDIIFWNGTLGVVENSTYEYGSKMLVDILIKSGKKIIIGGGDTAGYVNKFNNNFYHISTGGGAAIEYISDGSLIGVDYFCK
jgi:glyceraldehyde 3-phosphate dehydrogenase